MYNVLISSKFQSEWMVDTVDRDDSVHSESVKTLSIHKLQINMYKAPFSFEHKVIILVHLFSPLTL